MQKMILCCRCAESKCQYPCFSNKTATHTQLLSLVQNREGGSWNGATSLTINRPSSDDENPYTKSEIIHHYLFGYDLPDTVLLLTKEGQCVILSAKKKVEFLESAKGQETGGITELTLLLRDKTDDNAGNFEEMLKVARGKANGENVKIGILFKEHKGNTDLKQGSMVGGWEKKLTDDSAKVELVDVTAGISMVMATKDEVELDLMKKSSVLSNKVLKHGFIPKIESVIDEGTKTTHDKLAQEVDEIIEDPSKINLKVQKEAVQSCYFPIIQSGGEYDFKVSAQSTSSNVKYDVITVALGARYQNYCSNIARTLLVDPPKQVSAMYELLLGMQEACLKVMTPGQPLKAVWNAAVKYLQAQGKEELVESLPKNLGCAIGLDFRDSLLPLNAKATVPFRQGMMFNLCVSFAGLELSESARSATNSKSAVSSNKILLFHGP
jgi:nucleosome binding factor SPN SPT16 subunit